MKAKIARAPKISRRFLSLNIVGFILFLYCVLAAISDLRLAVPALVGVTAGLVGVTALIIYLGEKNALYWSPGMIMVVATLLRLIFLFSEPQLSDDIYRYLWDGHQFLDGRNPYKFAPTEVQIRSEKSALLLEKVNHPHLVTIYPPAAQLVFAAGSAFGADPLWIKGLFVAMDLFTCAVILQLLSFLKLPPWRAVLYAWHPLPVLEISGSGHIDGVGILFLFLTLVWVIYQPPVRSFNSSIKSSAFQPFLSNLFQNFSCLAAGLIFAFSGMVKLFPVIFFPACLILLRNGRKGLFIIGTLGGCVLLITPFLPDIQNVLVTLNTYMRRWEFAGLAFRFLRNVTGSADVPRLLLASLFITVVLIMYVRLYVQQNPNSQEGQLFDVIRTCYGISMAYLFFTPTLHPWYALYLVCFLPFIAGPAGLTLSWSVFLAYRVLTPYTILGQWIEDDLTPIMMWTAPVLAVILIQLFRRPFKKSDQGSLHV